MSAPKRTPSGLFDAVSIDSQGPVSGMRPLEAPTHSLPPPPSTERTVARMGAAMMALSGPSQVGLEAACKVLEAALADLLPERRVRVVPCASAEAEFANGEAEADETREFLVPDVVAPIARVLVEHTGAKPFDERAVEQDDAVLRTVAPFLAHALRSASAIDQLRDQVRQRDRLATIGRYSAELLHELATPLSAIGAHATLLRRTVTDPSVLDRAARIDEAATRMSELSVRVLRFARAAAEQSQRFSVAEVVDDALALCAPMIDGVGVIVERAYGVDLPAIEGRRGELTQVFVNLVVNALQAVEPQRGRIKVLVRGVGDHAIEARVEDDGRGIAPTLLPRVFEPFFTTKAAGSGTGLGLSIVRSIVEAHGARVTAESEPPRGTVFIVVFPAAEPLP